MLPRRTRVLAFALPCLALLMAAPAAGAAMSDLPAVAGIPVDFILFGLTLIGVALFHHYTLKIAVSGLAVITTYKLVFTGFKEGSGIGGLFAHLGHEWVVLSNLLLPANGIRAAVAPLREEPRPARAAAASCPTTGRAASCCC